MAEHVLHTALIALAHVSTVSKTNTLGYGDNQIGLLLEGGTNVVEECLHREYGLGQINEIGSSTAQNTGQSRGSGQPACVTSHNLYDGNGGNGVYRTVTDNLLHLGSDELSSASEAGSVVGTGQIVIDGLGKTNHTHIVIVGSDIAAQLFYGIHRIVAADIEEVANVVLTELLDQSIKESLILGGIGQLFTAGTKTGCGSLGENLQFLLVGSAVLIFKDLTEIYNASVEEALDTVTHTVQFCDASLGFLRECTADHTRQSCIDGGGRTAGLADNCGTDQFIHSHSPGLSHSL